MSFGSRTTAGSGARIPAPRGALRAARGAGGRRRVPLFPPGVGDLVRPRRVVREPGPPTPPAVGHSHHEGERHLPARAPAVAPDVVDELVERGVAEGVVLHLADW